MRIPFHHDRPHDELAMTPLIDVVFLLLIFFVCTASFQIAEQVLPSSVLAAGNTEAPLDDPMELPLEQIVVRTRMDGGRATWAINERSCATLGEVGQVLRGVFDAAPEVPVILHNDPGVPLGDVIDVYDISRVVGFETIQFAVQ